MYVYFPQQLWGLRQFRFRGGAGAASEPRVPGRFRGRFRDRVRGKFQAMFQGGSGQVPGHCFRNGVRDEGGSGSGQVHGKVPRRFRVGSGGVHGKNVLKTIWLGTGSPGRFRW